MLTDANDRVQRARAMDSTLVKTADRGLRLPPSVIPSLHCEREVDQLHRSRIVS